MIPHSRSGEHYARVERERLPGEPFLAALRRVAIEDAVRSTANNQSRAAKLIGCTPANITKAMQNARERRLELELHGAARPKVVRLPPAAARGAIL